MAKLLSPAARTHGLKVSPGIMTRAVSAQKMSKTRRTTTQMKVASGSVTLLAGARMYSGMYSPLMRTHWGQIGTTLASKFL